MMLDLQSLAPLISTFFFVGGSAYGLGRFMWRKFEDRMDRGDATLLIHLNEIKESRDIDLKLINKLAIDVSSLQLLIATQKGTTDTLTSIFTGQTHRLYQKDAD